MAMALYRDKQLGLKLESTPGVAEALTAADYGLTLTEIGTETGTEAIANQAFKGSISASPDRIGKSTAGASLAGELKNSGVANQAPKIDPILQAAKMTRHVTYSVGIATPANLAALIEGKSVILGATSAATALVIHKTASALYVVAVSGTLQSGEGISAGTFSATTSTAPVAAGFTYKPSSTADETLTVAINDGGISKPIYGAVANFAVSLTADSYPTWTASLQGVLDTAAWGTQATAVSGITWEDHLPAVVNNANLVVGGSVSPIASSVSLDLGNTLYVIPDLNSDNWLKYGVVTVRNATGSLVVMAIDPAEYSTYQALFAGQTATLAFEIGGAVAGTGIRVICPAVQYTGISESDDNGFLAQSIDVKATGTDDELFIWFR